jgi:transcriptional regulator with XRE-family HTH domain
MHDNDNMPNDYDARLGENIRAARLLHGFTQEQLADAIGISQPHLQRHEDGQHRVSVSRLQQIAAALGIEAAAMLA